MIGSKEMYEEMVELSLHKHKLQQLVESGQITESDYSVKKVDVPEFDYSHDKLWNELKAESVKAYKKLKEREFEIRNNQ